MVDGREHIGMRIQMQKAYLLAARQLAAPQPLNDAASDRMITADRHRPRPAGINIAIEIGNPLDAVLIVIGAWKRHIAGIDNGGRLPWIHLKAAMRTALQGGYIAYGARAQMLVTLGGPIAGGMRHTHQCDIGALGAGMRRAKQGRYPPPVKVVHHALIMLVSHCPAFREKNVTAQTMPQIGGKGQKNWPDEPDAGLAAGHFQKHILKIGLCRGHIINRDAGCIHDGNNLRRVHLVWIETDDQPIGVAASAASASKMRAKLDKFIGQRVGNCAAHTKVNFLAAGSGRL